MFDCAAAADLIVDLVVSDFGSYARFPSRARLVSVTLLQRACMAESMAAKVFPKSGPGNPFTWLPACQPFPCQRVPESELSQHPAPDFTRQVGHVPAMDISAAAPDKDVVMSIDVVPKKRCAPLFLSLPSPHLLAALPLHAPSPTRFDKSSSSRRNLSQPQPTSPPATSPHTFVQLPDSKREKR